MALTRGQTVAVGTGGALVVGLGAYWWVERRRTAASARATTTATQTTPSRSSTSTGGSSATTTSHAASATTTSTAQRSTPATNTGPPTVQVGSTGTVVKTLQTDLNTLTAWGLAVDGVFGPLTLAAVRAFQAARGITVDGIVGPVTWANIASTLVAQKQDPYVGGPSPGVSGRIQWPLLWQQAPSTAPSYVTRRCGYAWVTYKNPTGDGTWVAEYHDATKIRVFLGHGTAAVGTWTGGYVCPTSGSTGPPLVQVGSTGTVVKTLQTDLNTLTAWGLAVDGVFGPLTLAAVRAFQAARGITVDGIVGPVTWANIASTLVAQKQDPYVGGPSPGVSGRIQWPLLWQQAPSTAPSYVTRRCGYAWVTYKNPTGDGTWVAEYHDATKIRVFLGHGTAAVGTWTGGYVCPTSGSGTGTSSTGGAGSTSGGGSGGAPPRKE